MPVHSYKPGVAQVHRGRRTQEAPCINVIRSRLRACVCTRDVLYRDAARHVSRRSLGKTTSRLSNYRSCIMHRSPQLLLSLSLSLSFSVSLSRYLVSSPSPTLGVLVDRQKTRFQSSGGQSCGSAGISCGGDPLSDFLRRERRGWKKGGIRKCSVRARRGGARPLVKHVYACTRILSLLLLEGIREISVESSNNFIEFSPRTFKADDREINDSRNDKNVKIQIKLFIIHNIRLNYILLKFKAK